MSEEPDKTKEGLAVLASLALFVPMVLWKAAVTFWLWAWFAAPLGLPRIGYWHMAGVLLLFSVANGTRVDMKQPATQTLKVSAIVTVGLGVAALFGLWFRAAMF